MTSVYTIAPEIHEAACGIRLGVLTANVTVRPRDEGLTRETDERVRELEGLAATRTVDSIPEVAAVRRAYKALGKDPSRYRGSPEALLRRIAQGKGLYTVNTVVDVINLVSLETYHPLGLYDASHVHPPVVFRRGRAGETYAGISKGEINLEGLPLLADSDGPFGNPSSDSARSMVRDGTRRILLVIFAFHPGTDLGGHLERASGLLRSYAEARDVETRIVP